MLSLRLLVSSACLACAVLSLPVPAAVPDVWKDMVYSFKPVGAAATVGGQLTEFARTMGLRLDLPQRLPALRAAAVGSPGLAPSAYLDRLAQDSGLQWFVYDGVLHISPQGEAATVRIGLGQVPPAAAKQILTGLGLYEQKFGWGEIEEPASAVIVSGPASYVAAVQDVLGKAAATAEPGLMVFRLQHASADDYESSYRDQVQRFPGVASTLRAMLGGARQEGSQDRLSGMSGSMSSSSALTDNMLSARAPSNVGAGSFASGMANLNNAISGRSPLKVAGVSGSPGAGSLGARAQPIQIEAFAPLNAVMIRDQPERRPLYAELIALLDVPVPQIEILVTIVDADRDRLNEWGADLAVGRHGGLTSTVGGGSQVSQVGASANFVLWASDKLALRLRALESEGAARVVGNPSLLTQDNMAAVLDLSDSAYYRLVGERTADLKTVTVGTSLRVTPRVRQGSAEPAIQVRLDIEDGGITDAGNQGDTPRTNRAAVSTQAVVRPGESLVVGGYRRESTESYDGKVPVLGALPLIGGLFRGERKTGRTRERLFILTARVVGDESAAASSRTAAAAAPMVEPPAPAVVTLQLQRDWTPPERTRGGPP